MTRQAPDHQLSYPKMGKRTNIVNRESDLVTEVNDPEVVERQLQSTCFKLNETEVNIRLFSKMLENGVATNDVRSFVMKQAKLKSIKIVIG